MAAINQRLRDEHGPECSASSLRRYVRAKLPEEARREQVVVLREPASPGEGAQIDYGSMGIWTDPKSGKRRVWAFVMVLATSRHMFVRPVLTMDQHAWCTAHVEVFEFFGDVPARLVPDNLRTGVERPDLYDPKINRAYAELGEHYGTLVDPARSRKPRDKRRVERPVPYLRDSWWRGRDFTSPEEMCKAALAWRYSASVSGRLVPGGECTKLQAGRRSRCRSSPIRSPVSWSVPTTGRWCSTRWPTTHPRSC
ncbi:IS21 family transposase [Streptomyces gamaensis]|uniref:IS21 family transposase n=1 Tax=Streptomyces gamaensis TaxID=1763542 RepID=A0ABW0Z5T5_9ACTN